MSNVPKLRFKEFSGEWDETSIGDVSKIFGRIGYRGYTVNDIVEKGQGAIALSPGNFVNNRLKLENSTYISWFKYEESPEIMIENGDILFVKTGSTFGKTAFVTSLDEKATINPQIVVLKEITMSNTLLSYIVTNTAIKKQVQKIVVGGAIPTMSQKELAKMQFYLPYLEEQTKIASFLTSVDTKIEQLTKKEALLKQYKKGVMAQIFNQEIRFKDDDGSEFCEWEEKKLGEIGKFKSGTGFPEIEQGGNLGVPFYKVSDMNLLSNEEYMNISNNYVTKKQIERLRLKIIQEKAIIFAKVGAAIFLERKRLAENFLIDNNMMAFIPNENIYYIKHLFHTIRLSKYAQVGALPSYNASDLEIIKLNLPSLQEQEKIASFLTSVDTKIELTTKELNSTKEYKKALLQQMFV